MKKIVLLAALVALQPCIYAKEISSTPAKQTSTGSSISNPIIISAVALIFIIGASFMIYRKKKNTSDEEFIVIFDELNQPSNNEEIDENPQNKIMMQENTDYLFNLLKKYNRSNHHNIFNSLETKNLSAITESIERGIDLNLVDTITINSTHLKKGTIFECALENNLPKSIIELLKTKGANFKGLTNDMIQKHYAIMNLGYIPISNSLATPQNNAFFKYEQTSDSEVSLTSDQLDLASQILDEMFKDLKKQTHPNKTPSPEATDTAHFSDDSTEWLTPLSDSSE